MFPFPQAEGNQSILLGVDLALAVSLTLHRAQSSPSPSCLGTAVPDSQVCTDDSPIA